MVIMMNDSKLNSMAQIKSFLSKTKEIVFNKKSKKEAYCWIEETLSRFHYVILSKKEKGLIRRYLMKITGYSRAQLTRHIRQYRKTGQVKIKEYDRHKFEKKYTPQDISLLAQTAQVHDSPNGASLKKTLQRMAGEYGKEEYLNISHISVSHIYNLKKKVSYLRSVASYQKTNKGKAKAIGQRCKPQPQGQPGYLRVDTIHQGDRERQKGVYHINTVDELTQWEIIGAAEKITEEYLLPLLEKMIANYPFRIINFHCDNGSKYIPCAFPSEVIDSKGKIKKKYRYQDYQTPYEKLKSIPEVQKYLKDGITLEMLDEIARRYTDNEMAEKVQLARDQLFDKILAA